MAWSLASVMLPVVGFFAPLPTVSSSWDCASCWIRCLLLQAMVRVTLPPNTPFHPGHQPAVGWAYIILDVSIDFIALFLSFAQHCSFLVHGVTLSDVGARCFTRIDTASSGTAAYESPGTSTDLRASLCYVPWAIPQLQNVGKWLHMHIMLRFSVYGMLAHTHVCPGNICSSIERKK